MAAGTCRDGVSSFSKRNGIDRKEKRIGLKGGGAARKRRKPPTSATKANEARTRAKEFIAQERLCDRDGIERVFVSSLLVNTSGRFSFPLANGHQLFLLQPKHNVLRIPLQKIVDHFERLFSPSLTLIQNGEPLIRRLQ